MSLATRVAAYIQRLRHPARNSHISSEAQLLADGWDSYAREWKQELHPVLPGHLVHYVGDEWTAEEATVPGGPYGLPAHVVAEFNEYLNAHLLSPYLPHCAAQGLEIGPGGGRITALLIPRTDVLHVADASGIMLERLKQRFSKVSNLRYYYVSDGMTLPALQPASLDYVIAFDVFVHFEPRLVYWYLRQAAHLLKPGGTGIIHYANVLTPIGWQRFELNLESNVQGRSAYWAFGVMCPELMARFLEALQLEVVSSDIKLIPRDAVAIFRKPSRNESGLQ